MSLVFSEEVKRERHSRNTVYVRTDANQKEHLYGRAEETCSTGKSTKNIMREIKTWSFFRDLAKK